MRHSVMIKEKLTFFVLVSSPATNPASLGLKSGSRPQSANFNKRERVRFLFQCKHSRLKNRRKAANNPTLITLLRVPYLVHFGSSSFVLPIRPIYRLGVSPSLVSKYCEGYRFWST